MKQEVSLSVNASEFISWIGASTADFEKKKIKAINISMPAKAGLCDYPTYPFLIHGLVQVIVQKENINITSLIHITDESNLEKIMIEQTPYDTKQNKLCSEVKGVFLSHSDVREVLANLFNNSSYTYSTPNCS